MLTREAAQGLTDALSAVALAAYAAAALRRRVRSPLEGRLLMLFGALAAFYAARGVSLILGQPELKGWAQLFAPFLPVAGLFLVEGLLRRHAPVLLKVLIPLGAVCVCAALIVAGRSPEVSTWGLGGYVALSLLALTILLLFRDRKSLSHQENVTIGSFLAAAAGLMLLSLTDFDLDTWLGMSGVGAAGLAFIATVKPTSIGGGQRAALDLVVLALVGLVFAQGLALALGIPVGVETARLGVVMFTLTLAVATVLRALQRRAGYDGAQGLRRALAQAEVSSLSDFLETLAGEPALKGLRLATDVQLADYDGAALLQTLRTRPVWTRQALRDLPAATPDRGAEELADLMARADATHAGLISERPLRIGLLTLPEIGLGEEAEVDFALFCKLATLAAEEGA
jgi:hypothetical protein